VKRERKLHSEGTKKEVNQPVIKNRHTAFFSTHSFYSTLREEEGCVGYGCGGWICTKEAFLWKNCCAKCETYLVVWYGIVLWYDQPIIVFRLLPWQWRGLPSLSLGSHLYHIVPYHTWHFGADVALSQWLSHYFGGMVLVPLYCQT
jgi:hypothetical protein